MVTEVLPEEKPATTRTAGAQTAEKAMQVLLTVAEQAEPISLVALSRAAGIEKTTTHRLVTSLVRYGLLRFDSRTRTYSLGLRLVDLGQRALAQLDVVREARPHLERLGALSGEAVHVGVFEDGQVVFVGQVPSPHPVVIRVRVGTRAPSHCTAAGKVLLAFGPRTRLEQVLTLHGLSNMTPNTITDPDDFRDHLARVRRLGYALDDEEHRIGVRCVAAPVRDATGAAIASISISGPAFRLPREQIDELAGPLVEASNALSAVFGHRTDHAPVAASAGQRD
ncbi:MAG: IclR family transcriptional regulator [Thermomicrobiales bacterium]